MYVKSRTGTGSRSRILSHIIPHLQPTDILVVLYYHTAGQDGNVVEKKIT